MSDQLGYMNKEWKEVLEETLRSFQDTEMEIRKFNKVVEEVDRNLKNLTRQEGGYKEIKQSSGRKMEGKDGGI